MVRTLTEAGFEAYTDTAFLNPRLWTKVSDLDGNEVPWWKGTGWNLLWMKRESSKAPSDGIVVQRRNTYAMKESLGRVQRIVRRWNRPRSQVKLKSYSF